MSSFWLPHSLLSTDALRGGSAERLAHAVCHVLNRLNSISNQKRAQPFSRCTPMVLRHKGNDSRNTRSSSQYVHRCQLYQVTGTMQYIVDRQGEGCHRTKPSLLVVSDDRCSITAYCVPAGRLKRHLHTNPRTRVPRLLLV